MNIRLIPYNEIDKIRWDDCISRATNGLIYAYSWYLDAMCDHWDALVMNDYEAVMPLTHNRKYGIHYLFQPYFCASLGVFFARKSNEATVLAFLNAVPRKYRYWDICLNHGNYFNLSEYQPVQRRNYFLPLVKDYSTLFSGYRENLKRNIKKAEQSGLKVEYNIDPRLVIALAKPTLQRISSITDEHFERFLKVIEEAEKRKVVETIAIRGLNSELLASAVFFYSNGRWYYILPGNHPNGKTLGASHYLLDRFIAKHAGTETMLDFEGSDVGNLAFFYSGYGAMEEYYPAIRLNKLPAILKWLKKH